MAEVSQNSPADAALSNNTKGASLQGLDLRSWQGLTEVLKRAREAGLSSSEYAEFRNLILQYAQRGGDAEYMKQIEATIARFSAPTVSSHNSTPAPATQPASVVTEQPVQTPPTDLLPPINTFAATTDRRKTPSFLPVHPGEYPPHPEPTTEPAPTPVTQVAPPQAAPRPTMAPQAFAAPPQTAPVTPATPVAPIVPPPMPTEPPMSAPASAPIPETPVYTPPTPTAVDPAHPQFKTLEEQKARIADIKRIVNGRVGNPATLMDSQNQAGREYMAALLGAMKATAGGGSALDTAMLALEQSYARILEELQTAPAPAAPATSAPTAEPTPTPIPVPPAPIPIPVPPQPTPATPIASPIPVPVPPQPVSAAVPPIPVPIVPPPMPPVVPSIPPVMPDPVPAAPQPAAPITESVSVTEPTAALSEPYAEPRVPMLDLPTLPGDDKAERVILSDIDNIQSEKTVSWEKSSVTKPTESTNIAWQEPKEPATKIPFSTRPAVPSVSLDKQNYDPQIEGIAAPIAEALTRQADLTSPEITVALNQLLTEWTIFASSGLFGIGPGGAEHPIYRRIAGLSMGEVMAGRWEKATPELRRTINDYVNAWRHEQGVAYNPAETFEHYLRRVVHRILKRQRS